MINSFPGIFESASSGSIESLGVSRVLKISDVNLQKFKFYFQSILEASEQSNKNSQTKNYFEKLPGRIYNFLIFQKR